MMDHPDYQALAAVLKAAYEQATTGKGAERHARDNPFHEQHMQTISNLLDSDRGMAFQAIKKLTEGLDFTDPDRRERELLGVIVYVAGIIVWHRAKQQHSTPSGKITVHFGEQPAHPAPISCCPDCGAPEGDLHYVLCPRLQVPEEHVKAVEEVFAAEQVVTDMSDWRNWQVGDLLEINNRGGSSGHEFRPGDVVRILSTGEYEDARFKCEYQDRRDFWFIHESEATWHSRPQAEQFDEARTDIIGQNGNDGEHYAVPTGVDINDWRTWQVGDKLECVEACVDGDDPDDEIAAHEIVTIVEVEPREYSGDLPIKVQGTRYFGWPDFDDYEQPEGAPLRQLFRFHHRPAETDE